MSAERILPIEDRPRHGRRLRRGAGAPPRRAVVFELRRRPSPAPRLLLPLRQLRPRWRQVAGRGTLYAWTIVEHPTHPAYEVPYTVVLVDLDEAPEVRLAGNLPGRPTLEVGMPMEVWWDDVDGQAVLPNWRPASQGPRALTERTLPMAPSSPLGDALPPALAAYWRALDAGRFPDAAACFSRDAVYAVPIPRDVETAPRAVTTGSAALLARFRERGTAALATRRLPVRGRRR